MSNDKKEHLYNVFQKFLQVLSAVNDNCLMKINKRGLEFVSVDDNHRCIADAFISKKIFPKWKVLKESYASVNLSLLKKIFASDTLIEGIRQNNNSEVEIFVRKPLKMSLLIRSNFECEDIDARIKHAIDGNVFFEAILPSKDLMVLLRRTKHAFDEISFCISNGNVVCSANFLNFSILKTLTADVMIMKLKILKFSVPMKYLSTIIPALSLSNKLKITLTDRGIMKALLLLNGGKYKLSLFISSRIE